MNIPSLFTPCFRWYGPQDPFSLDDICQAGATGIVTALHQVPVGEVWTVEDIWERKQMIENMPANRGKLTWEVVESLPVHDEIKRGTKSGKTYISQYSESLENLGKCGIRTVCYNFMPVLDWLRTDLRYETETGARTLRFEYEKLIVFDRYILERKGAERDYSEREWKKAEGVFQQMTVREVEELRNTILLGLPGDTLNFSLDGLKERLEEYDSLDTEQLRENLHNFLSQVVPVAESAGIKLAIHPDDPPFPVFGLPRIVSTSADIKFILESIPSPTNGITLCTGSLGAIPDNNLIKIINNWESRIHFLHLRSVSRWGYRNFMEANHLEGDADLFSVVNALWKQRKERVGADHPEFSLPIRPDHGMQMLDDLSKSFYPGYSAIGRLRGLGELRGMELAISKELNNPKS